MYRFCLHTNSPVSIFFPRIPGVPEDPHDVLEKRDSASWSPAPSHLPPAPVLHRRTPPARFHSNHNETMRLLGDSYPPPSSGLTVGGRRPLSTSFFYFFFLDKLHSIHSSFSLPAPGTPPIPRLFQEPERYKTIPEEGGKSPRSKRDQIWKLVWTSCGNKGSIWLDEIYFKTCWTVRWHDGEMMMMMMMMMMMLKRLHVLIYGRKKKKKRSFKPRPLWIWREFSHGCRSTPSLIGR